MSRPSKIEQARLSVRNRRVVEMYFMDNMTQTEIAAELGVGQQCVSQILRKEASQAYADELMAAATSDALKLVKMASIKAARRELETLDHKDVYAKLQAARDLLDRAGIKDKDASSVKVELVGADITMIGEAQDAEGTAELPTDG